MADYDPPFAESGPLRAPDATEQSLGIPCGGFDLAMFNYLLNLGQGQIKNIADEAGVSSLSEGDKTVLLRAVLALIDAATGGNPAGYILMDQARARLPIFPEVMNVDGRIVVTSPATGTVRVPGGIDFLHRGIFSVTTVQTDFATMGSKIYHIRWSAVDGFSINDLSSSSYNPTAAAETDRIFDSTYDDMLIARIITNSSNVATIDNLANRNRLKHSYERDYLIYPPSGAFPPEATETIDYNLGRTPQFVLHGFEESGLNIVPLSVTDGSETNFTVVRNDRYSSDIRTMSWSHIHGSGGRPHYAASFVCLD